MRSDLIRIYKSVHTWTGILAGMALFIAFYAGALTMFKEPIARWASPPTAGAAEVPLARVPELIDRTLAQRPLAAQEFRIHLREAEHLDARMDWYQHDGPAGAVAEEAHHDQRRYFQSTLDGHGEVQVSEASPTQLAEFIDVLHRVVGLPVDNDSNRWVMGVVSVLYAVALISGLIILLPTLVQDLFALRIGRNLKRMWLDAHNVVGLFSLPFHLVMAISAIVFAFHDGIYLAQDKLIHQGRLEALWGGPPPADPPGAATRRPADMLPPEELLQRVRDIAPRFQPDMLQYIRVTSQRANVRVWGRDERGITRSAIGGFAVLDPYSGRVVSREYLPGHQPVAAATVTSFFALHFGSFGGDVTAWLYFLLGLGGAFVFYSGNLLWIESRRKLQRRDPGPPPQNRSAHVMGALSVGVCLGCVIGISLTIVVAKWLHGVSGLAGWHMAIYYAVFSASIVWALLRGAARSASELLWAAAGATLAIPLTSLLAWAIPPLNLWTHASGTALGVDFTALAGALVWAWLARLSGRRFRRGPPDSVWAAATQRPRA